MVQTDPKLHPGISRSTMLAAFAAITLALLGGGYWYYRAQAVAVHQSGYENIASVARLKVGQIEMWRKERLMDVERDANSATIAEALEKSARNGGTPEIRNRTLGILKIARRGMYSHTLVISPSGQVLFSVGDSPVLIDDSTRRALSTALANRTGVISDFFRDADGEVKIDTVAAVRDTDGKPLGFMLLRCLASAYLYPLIQAWPTPSRSAETLLVQRQGDEIVFLNELRHRSKTALALRQPLSRTDNPAVQAVLGRRGMFDGKDYRNKPVVAELGAIPGSPWFLVAKVDQDEILAEARYRATGTAIIVGALILLAGAATASVYKRQQLGLLRKLLESENLQQETQEQFRTTLYSIGDGLIATDSEGRITLMNTVAERLTGWSLEEAFGRPMAEVFRIINAQTRKVVSDPVQKVLEHGVTVGLANHTVLLARDGKEYHIADSAAPIRVAEGRIMGMVLVFSDVSEQYRMREALYQSEARLNFALQTVQIGAWEMDLQDNTVKRSLIHDRIHGYETLLPKWTYEMFLEHVLPEDRPHVEQNFKHATATQSNWGFECRIRRADGEVCWIWCAGGHERDSEGKLLRLAGIVQDITERKLVEEELRESERLLKESQSIASLGSYVLDIPAGLWKSSEVLDELFGIGQSYERSVDGWAALIHPDDRAMMSDYFKNEVIGHGRTFNKEYRIIRHKDQAECWVHGIGKLVFDAQGCPVKMHGTIQDITERKRAEETLRRNEARFRSLTALLQSRKETTQEFLDFALSEAIALTGSKLGYIYFYHEDRKQFVLNTWSKAVMSECRILNPQTCYELDKTGVWGEAVRQRRPIILNDFEAKHPLKKGYPEGHARLLKYLTIPVMSGDKIVAVVGVANKEHDYDNTDIEQLQLLMGAVWKVVEQRQAEMVSRQLAAIVESSDDAIIGKNLDSIITSWNKGAEKIFGYAASEMVGTSILRLIPRDRQDEEHQILEKIYRGDSLEYFETVRQAKDGRLIDVSITASPIKDALGQIIGVSKIARNITLHKRMEENLLRTQRMESLGTLASGVAHDLNNILTPIILSTEMLRAVDEPDTRKGLLESIEQCAKRGADVVNQVLIFARGAKGNHITMDLERIAKETEKIMRETFPRNIAISSSIVSDLWPVKGDPTQLHQVVLNLCINARDAMPGGGTLSVSLENAEIDENFAVMVVDAKEGAYVMLTVADSGTGIPPEIRSKIFDPFFTTKEVGKGTGLGLSSALGIVRSHGGFVTVESQEGRGSTFNVFLPIATGVTAEAEPIAKTSTPYANEETILVVDDETVIANALSMVLKSKGFKVLTANDGGEALLLYKKHADEIDLVLTDVIMPGMDGVELTRALHEINPNVKIIASTGQATETRQAELRALGVSVILRKPYDAKTLLATLHNAIHAEGRN